MTRTRPLAPWFEMREHQTEVRALSYEAEALNAEEVEHVRLRPNDVLGFERDRRRIGKRRSVRSLQQNEEITDVLIRNERGRRAREHVPGDDEPDREQRPRHAAVTHGA